MEVCRKCKQTIKEDEKFLNILASWTLGFAGKGKYHLECWNQSKKNAIKIYIVAGIVILIPIIVSFIFIFTR